MTQWQQWLTIFGPVLAIFGIMAAGTVMRRINWLTEEADHSLLKVVINLLVPCLIFDVIVGNESLRNPANVWLPPLVGFGTTVLGFAVAWGCGTLLGRLTGTQSTAQVGTFAFCIGVYNYGYLPLPLAIAMFDSGTVGVLFVHNIGVDIAMWTVGIAMLRPAGSGSGSAWWKSLINVPSLSIIAALLLNPIDPARLVPGFIASGVSLGVEMLGQCAIPMALLLIGATIADHLPSMQFHRGKRTVLASLLLRVGLLPVAFLALAWVLYPRLASPELRDVMILEAAMPAAVMPIVLARHYGGDVPTALRVVLGTSLAGLVTIPLWISAGLWLFGVG